MKQIAHIIYLALAVPLWAQSFEDVTDHIGPRNAKLSTNLAWGDFDGDDQLDLYITNGRSASGSASFNALYRNLGDATFADVTNFTARNYIQLNGSNSTAAAWADYDSDGDLDLYVANLDEQDLLFQNRHVDFTSAKNSWIERIDEDWMGIAPKTPGASTAVAWGDGDNDGDLDLYIGKYYHENLLYLNNGDETFVLAPELGLNDWRDTGDATWIDYDSDGDLDLYLVNSQQNNTLYRNDSAGSTFAEVACALSVGNRKIGRTAAWADYDNDGDPDLLLANAGANALYRNDGDDRFVDVAAPAGVHLVDGHWMTAAAAWADYDGDGWLDLYLANGDDKQLQPDQLLTNNGDGTFADVTAAKGLPTEPSYHTAAAWGDYDNDGAPDLYVADGAAQGDRLFRNTSPFGRFIKVWIRSKEGPKPPSLGTRVQLVTANANALLASRLVRARPGGRELIFGVPATEGPYKLLIAFPGHDKDVVVENIEAGAGPILVQEP
ncbi:MAG: hypothetical protein GKR89_28990 [Candidatus Latescibacteria bacterium]|nr:hypothetical protein [Candidatus Latescibacterota bacterium]